MQYDDLRILSQQSVIKPSELIAALPLTFEAAKNINSAREITTNIIEGHDPRLLVVVGPCSIHDYDSALDYAYHLKEAALRYSEKLFIIMRVYLEKPRTNLGWKGYINDPFLNGSSNINAGLELSRKLLLELSTIGMPAATEFLDTIIPQYLSDLISWTAIGARTSESQIHRELASGLSMPVGFKNTTDGNIQVAVDAAQTARHPHHFLGISKQGSPAIINTTGNKAVHIILRGSHHSTNYTNKNVKLAVKALTHANLTTRLMIDCNHGNSQKNHKRQFNVINSIIKQLEQGKQNIMGVMLESHLIEGKQRIENNKALTYGQSITDGCISWRETEKILEKLAACEK
ncbi:MAG: 3-deoxy-7-phosphoheptulonate synthase [Gammaproteobacteria bacterium]|nr:3-deoxy-7-phosphoheptulonate synthase [Gammaproteobacteria bacterium]